MAKRDKLTDQQQRRVAKRRKESAPVETDHLGKLKSGIVISRFGEQVDIADSAHQQYRLYLRQHLGECVSGDNVNYRLDDHGQGVVESIEERRSVLTRTTAYGGEKAVVANIDRIFIITAPFPDYSSVMVDRYLVAARLANIDVAIVFNKSDLESNAEFENLDGQKKLYRSLGIPIFSVSCKSQTGLNELQAALGDHKSILVGQSGVGKSSLINALLPHTDTLVGEVSDNSRLGTHTTTTSKLHFLPNEGYVIDSPGVREFNLGHIDPSALQQGFVEFATLGQTCKFRDCKHLKEPGCAVLAAVAKGTITEQRLESYQRILESLSSP